ncbi:RNA polymerase sigma factor [Bacillus phage 268TH004]|uniref:RNA polymerase sigma factor n=1 Tax=Bacillus phage 268TH004 TaxID=2801523 RepID=A0A7T8C666_9CAUD|nr:RNA polymerase sigma factor [Bacillus phage 268TH004]
MTNFIETLKREVSQKQPARKHNEDHDRVKIDYYLRGTEKAGLDLMLDYVDIISYIYKQPHKPQFNKKTGLEIDWTAQDKEDLLQEICLHFFQLIHEYDPAEGKFEALIKGKLHPRVYKSFAMKACDVKVFETELEDNCTFEAKSAQILLDDSMTEILPQQYIELYRAFNKLSDKQRKAVELIIINEWNSKQVAEELGCSPSTARTHLQRGLERLKDIMLPEGEKEKCQTVKLVSLPLMSELPSATVNK